MSSLLKETFNTRDLGWHQRNSGGLTVPNRIWRSDYIPYLSEDDRQTLLRNGITNIIDLRADGRKQYPEGLKSDERFNCISLPLHTKDISVAHIDKTAQTYYRMAVSSDMKRILKTIANLDGGVLFHCMAGKDRTGVVAAVVLLLCEVTKLDVVDDYAASLSAMLPIVETYYNEPLNHYVMPTGDIMVEFLDIFFRMNKNIGGYISNIGLLDGEVYSIRRKLCSW